jgi:hypothetical protein
VAGVLGILSGVGGIIDMVANFFPSSVGVLGTLDSMAAEVTASSAERLVSDVSLITEFVVGPFYIIGVLRKLDYKPEKKVMLKGMVDIQKYPVYCKRRWQCYSSKKIGHQQWLSAI